MKYCLLFSLLFCITITKSQAQADSISKNIVSKALESGYIQTKYFDFDLRYLIKYNQYEGFRTGLGGVTNSNLSEIIRFEGYIVYGFLDDQFKYNFGTGLRLSKKKSTWLNLSYTDDLQETGSSKFLTDQRFFQLFEPRLLNIELFYQHMTKAISLEHQLAPAILTEIKFATSKINPKFKYTYNNEILGAYTNYNLSLFTFSTQLSLFSKFKKTSSGLIETSSGFPKFAIQYTKSFSKAFGGDFGFSKLDFRAVQQINYNRAALTEFVFAGGIAKGDIPITHTYHAYPNNVNKETILQRFSVAGTNSFETMYFNEFYSDKFATMQIKHRLNPIIISPWLKPELVFIYRYAVGDMENIERHENINFSSLKKGYSEAGFEINKLLFGFGLSFAYRHGAHHLPEFEDNFAFKFTFNLNLNR